MSLQGRLKKIDEHAIRLLRTQKKKQLMAKYVETGDRLYWVQVINTNNTSFQLDLKQIERLPPEKRFLKMELR